MEKEVEVTIRGLRRRLTEGLAALLLYSEAALPQPERVLALGAYYSAAAEDQLPALAAALENEFEAARLYLSLIGAEDELAAALL